MALATRPKPKVQHKKRQAQHHRQGKHYLKAYWPYLPMLMIVGSGLVINSLWSASSAYAADGQLMTPLQFFTDNQATWLSVAVAAMAGAAFVLFTTRHGLRLHRMLVRGESFIRHHYPLLDISLVFIFTAGFVLTRASGLI